MARERNSRDGKRIVIRSVASARSRNTPGDLSSPGIPELYIDADLGEGWTARYRIRDQDGVLVVAELHLFYGTPQKSLTKVEWEGLPGPENRVPDGGLTDAIRRSAPLGTAMVSRVFEARERFAQALRTLVGGFDVRTTPKRTTRRTRDDLFYADIADRYVQMCVRYPRRPVVMLAKELGESDRDKVRDWIHEARRRELLTGSAGRAGGELRNKAREILARARNGRKR